MIRKDVKLGLAVGGVLLAVLVVYVLVVPESAEPGADLALDDDAAALVSPEDAAIIPVEPGVSSAEPEPVITATPNVTDTAATPADAEGDPFANPADDPAFAARRANGWDWGKLLNGENAPTLMSETTTNAGVGTTPAAQPQQVSLVSSESQEAQPIYATGGGTAASRAGASANTAMATSTAAAPSGRRTHVVQTGETLSSIARAAYGRASYFPHILRANPGVDPKRLRPGDVITLPGIDEVRPTGTGTATAGTTASTSQEQPINAASEYRVQTGDSLYTISMRLYGRGDRIDAIYELNRDTIGPNKNALKVGTLLRLPAAPTTGR